MGLLEKQLKFFWAYFNDVQVIITRYICIHCKSF